MAKQKVKIFVHKNNLIKDLFIFSETHHLKPILESSSEQINSTVTTTASVPSFAQQPNSPNSTQSPKSSIVIDKPNSTSFALQTSSSRISTLDMLPQLLQAELDLAEVARSLRTPPATFQSEGDDFLTDRTSPSPHRLSHLIASLEAAQEHLANDVIDLTTIPPPQVPVQSQVSLPLNEEIKMRKDVQLTDTETHKQQQQQQRKSLDTSRVVAELDHLCDTLLEMKTTSNNELHNQQQFNKIATQKLKDDNIKQQQKEKEQQFFDESLLMTFDQLTASINKLIFEGTETETGKDQKESISKMVIPPPPPDSPTQLKEQDEIIKRFWEATEDVKTMIAFRKQKQQQQQLAYLQLQQQQQMQQQFSDQKNTIAKNLLFESDPVTLQKQQQHQQQFQQKSKHVKTTINKSVPVSSGQFSSDSTAVNTNTSSDSESDITPGNNAAYQQLTDENIAKQRQYLQEEPRQHQQQNPYFPYPVQHLSEQMPIFPFNSNSNQGHQSHSLRHHQHQNPFRSPRSAIAEKMQYLQCPRMPSNMLHQQPTSESDHFRQMMIANQINNFDNSTTNFLMNNQVLHN